jgi:hypothetical protein
MERPVSQFFTGLLKLILASMIAGALMNLFGLSADRLLSAVGLTPVELWDHVVRFIAWAIPNVILGAVIILPLWFCAYLFIPPRNGGTN